MKKRFWGTFLIGIIGFSALFAGAGRYILNKDSIASIGDSQEDDLDEIELDGKDEIIFLLTGIDESSGIEKIKEKRIKENEYVTTGYRTDTMMLCKFNFETGDISILSIPRDTRVNIRGRENKEKINHAYSYGGPYLTLRTVKDLLQIDLDYYVTVDYLAVKEIVDSIGGVDIDVPMNMRKSDPTDKPPLDINLTKGLQTLYGKESLDFLRFRDYPDGDVGRVHAQQLFMKEFMKQVLQPKNITKLPKMAKTYFDNVDTNIPMGVVLKGVASANKIDMDNLNIQTLPGDGQYVGPVSYFLYDEIELEALVREMFGDFLIGQ